MLVIIIKKNLKEAESAKKGRPGHTIFGASCHTMFGTFCHTIFGASFGRLLTTTSKRKNETVHQSFNVGIFTNKENNFQTS